jgi:hypothetical protein
MGGWLSAACCLLPVACRLFSFSFPCLPSAYQSLVVPALIHFTSLHSTPSPSTPFFTSSTSAVCARISSSTTLSLLRIASTVARNTGTITPVAHHGLHSIPNAGRGLQSRCAGRKHSRRSRKLYLRYLPAELVLLGISSLLQRQHGFHHSLRSFHTGLYRSRRLQQRMARLHHRHGLRVYSRGCWLCWKSVGVQ